MFSVILGCEVGVVVSVVLRHSFRVVLLGAGRWVGVVGFFSSPLLALLGVLVDLGGDATPFLVCAIAIILGFLFKKLSVVSEEDIPENFTGDPSRCGDRSDRLLFFEAVVVKSDLDRDLGLKFCLGLGDCDFDRERDLGLDF